MQLFSIWERLARPFPGLKIIKFSKICLITCVRHYVAWVSGVSEEKGKMEGKISSPLAP